jgi:alkylation response protein AidB-like acyl-CoA dehydrogenase
MASGESLSLNARVRDSINRLEAQVLALEMMVLRVAADESTDPGPKASILKIRGSELQMELAKLQMQVAGSEALPYAPEWMLAESAFHGPGPEYSAAAAAAADDEAPIRCERTGVRAKDFFLRRDWNTMFIVSAGESESEFSGINPGMQKRINSGLVVRLAAT